MLKLSFMSVNQYSTQNYIHYDLTTSLQVIIPGKLLINLNCVVTDAAKYD